MRSRLVTEAENFIQKSTTVKEFYRFITSNGTAFSFDIHEKACYGSTILHMACLANNFNLAKAFIKMGANVNAQRLDLTTALSDAIINCQLDMIQLLVDNGANVCDEFSESTQFGKNAYIELAVAHEKPEITGYLITKISSSLNELIINKLKYNSDFYKVSKELFFSTKKIKDNDSFIISQNILPQDCIDLIKDYDDELSDELTEKAMMKFEKLRVDIKNSVKRDDVKSLKHFLSNGRYDVDLALLFLNEKDPLTKVAVLNGNLEMVQLLVECGDLVCEPGSYEVLTIAQLAEEAGFPHISSFLEDIQTQRYNILLNEATKEERKILSKKGTFFNSESVLDTQSCKSEQTAVIFAQNQ